MTGGSGFIGPHVISALATTYDSVVSADLIDPPPQNLEVLLDRSSRVEFVRADVTDLVKMLELVKAKGVKEIVHLARGVSPARLASKVNIDSTLQLLEIARLTDIRKLLFVGTSMAYGLRKDMQPISEQDPVDPQDPYAVTKFAAERLGFYYNRTYGLDFRVVRLSSIYGPLYPFQTEKGLRPFSLGETLQSVIQNKPVKFGKGGDYVRDYTYVKDAVAGLALLIKAEKLPYSLYNVSSGRNYSLKEVFETIREIVPSANLQIDDGVFDGFDRTLRGPLDITRIKALGFMPAYSLRDGLEEYISWLRKHSY